jgi:hypothetical protein
LVTVILENLKKHFTGLEKMVGQVYEGGAVAFKIELGFS